MKSSIYGLHAIEALLNTQPSSIEFICVISGRQDERAQSVLALAKEVGVKIQFVSKKELESVLEKGAVHQGVVAQCKQYAGLDESALDSLFEKAGIGALFLILDGVQDPHNLGAILRSANAFGVDAVIAPKDRAASLTPVVHKIACGAASITPFVRVTNLARTLRDLKEKGVWLVGLDEHTETNLVEVDLTGPIGLILGNEGQGMRKLTKKHCDFLAKIDLKGEIQSLNVSVACACGLYEVHRQRS